MACSQPFKGQIKLVTGNQRKTLLNFDLPEKEASFSDFLMCSHSKLKLTKEEKRELSLDHRKIIQQYLSLDSKTLLEYVDEFVSALPDSKKWIKVTTQDFGSYICLAAISMGKIPKDLRVSFELLDTPTELIPKKLNKNLQRKNISVNFTYSEDSWVTPFKSLYKTAA
ncbi:hypothetical protein BIY24_03430 [Halobacteriovorax marinus]|uniref:Uncharacterized protein n=1 Tax=Halobacteriovorax marinus (strain ATCC BAA-682 / DSM 15412 / SJ) TaxID=862908 RepID=E1X5N0_HALMS|nr:hypothetical protein [Halobacteriovorax marinus]ATH07020.1 hypothetical protein BIY24_03430 [Halobacteriovorax marinus]CBW25597.1 hypothetical protein BMS_0692 [Halobacteriovorax marinus SJ]